MNWSTRRKLLYLGSFLIIFIGIIISVYFIYFHTAASCNDGRKNGTETGVDCGGDCIRLCPRANADPVIEWTRAFFISSSTYSLVSYVENPNIDAGSSYAPYTFTVFDDQNKLVFTKTGATIIPPGKRFAVFEGPMQIISSRPILRVEFSLGEMNWDRMNRTDLTLKADQIRLTRDVPAPRVDATLENQSLADTKNVEAVAIVYNDSGNAIAASRTLVDFVPKEGSQGIVFTWPQPFKEQYTRCDVPSDIALIIDRSGSMASDAANPPEPLTSVKKAAEMFVAGIGKGANMALISFSSSASVPVDQELTSSRESLIKALESVKILSTGIQETNITDALTAAGFTLMGSSTTRKAVVLLTDGEPTLPKSSKEKDFPALSASKKASELKNNGLEIYTIGLGSKINDQLLLDMASDKNHYYKVPNKADLEAIYSKIASGLCTKHPVIEIITRIFPDSN